MNGPAHVQIRIQERAIFLAESWKAKKPVLWERLFGMRDPEPGEIFEANQKRLFRHVVATMEGRSLFLACEDGRLAFTPEEVDEVARWWNTYFESAGFAVDYSEEVVGMEDNDGRVLAERHEENDG